jgi:hypothetical protein
MVRGMGVAVSVSTSTSARSLHGLLVAHAEAVFLVDDEQAQVLELRLFAQQLVRADHDVHLPSARPLRAA